MTLKRQVEGYDCPAIKTAESLALMGANVHFDS